MQTDTLIIGGGLSGLYLAYRLTQAQHPFLLMEARDRLGGRILSQAATHLKADTGACYDLGPAWMWPALQPLLRRLLLELGLSCFAQYTQGGILYEDAQDAAPRRFHEPSAHGHSQRLTGGAGRLVAQLSATLPAPSLLLNQRLVRLVRQASGVEAYMLDTQGSHTRITAQRVVLALPPRLLARNVEFEPALPASTRTAWINTPTWMAGQAKMLALYPAPFWREQGLSGEVYSRRGPLTEIYDASPASGGPYALFGFFAIAPHARQALGETQLQRLCLAQLRRLFGADAATPLAFHIKDWTADSLTATEDDRLAPAHHPDYGAMNADRTVWNGQLIRAGSETAAISGGYLEGALEAAEAALAHLRAGPGECHAGAR